MIAKRLAGLTCVVMLASGALGVSSAAAAGTLTGAGSTLVAPLEGEWGAAWGNATGNSVQYSPVGSGKGEGEIAKGLVDFGASDAPLSVYAATSPCNGCEQIPWAISAVGVSFNLPGVHKLRLTGPVIAQIYLGQITNWSDHRIASLNKGVHLPNLNISVFWRNDSSGDTYAFTRYLSDVSSSFAHSVGSSVVVNFPVGAGAHGNSGMAAAVAQTTGAIAYVTTAYLINDRLPAAYVKNAAGKWIVPNLSAIEAAAKAVHSIGGDNSINIINPSRRAKSAYPISTYTYAMFPQNAPQGTLLKSFLTYAVTQGQAFGPRLDFAPIPSRVRSRDLSVISGIS